MGLSIPGRCRDWSGLQSTSFCDLGGPFSSEILPLLLFRVVGEAVWNATAPDEDKLNTIRQKCEEPRSDVGLSNSSTDAVWLTSIGKWLPGSWADAQIADRAVKSDDALVDFSPWYNRIRLVLPCPLGTLLTMEKLGMQIWRRALRKSFLSYLDERYGPGWLSMSTQRPGSAVSQGPPAKRRRKGLPRLGARLRAIPMRG